MSKMVNAIVLIALFFTTHTNSMPRKIPVTTTLSKYDHRQIDCLAKNIYYEAVGETKKGQIAVAFVTMNRVKSGYFPDDVCGVVKQKTGNTCQFSWFCQKKALTRPKPEQYNDLVPIAENVYFNHKYMKDPTKGALFYHANYVDPTWNRRMRKTEVIGKHIFYKPKENKDARI